MTKPGNTVFFTKYNHRAILQCTNLFPDSPGEYNSGEGDVPAEVSTTLSSCLLLPCWRFWYEMIVISV